MRDTFAIPGFFVGAWAFCALLQTGCPPTPGPGNPPGNTPLLAAAQIEARSGSAVTGSATFEQVGSRTKVHIEISGATPGQHGLHIHELGDCSAADGKSAGDHYNPAKMEHGSLDKPVHHAGDFGNIEVNQDGTGKLELETDQISLGTANNAILGRSIVVHEKPDDTVTQPTGNSGARIGCGVISAKK